MNSPAIANIAHFLPEIAASRPNDRAVVFPEGRDAAGRVSYTQLTYAQLEQDSQLIARGLAAKGLGKGSRTVLMVTPSLDFFSLTFALFKLGAIPVLIDPGMGLKNLKQCLLEADPEAFIGVTRAHVARLILRWPSGRLKVTVGRRLFWGGPDLAEVRAAGTGFNDPLPSTNAEEMAAILFTSGSTGVPKGVVYSHRTFLTQVDILKQVYGITPGEIDLATFPLFALFGPALGMTAIVPDMDASRPARVDPAKIFEAIENFGVTNMFGSPALLDRVARQGGEQGVKLPTLKRVISAGAPVRSDIMRLFGKMLPPTTEIFTPYGATESLPVCSIGSKEILGETAAATALGAGVCVGRPVRGVDLRVIAISDEAIEDYSDGLLLPVGEIGEIIVRGPVVTRTYYHRDVSTRLAKIVDGTTFFHRMGDLGYLDEKGRVWFCGRKSHRLITASGTLFTMPCEGIFNTHAAVFRSALVGVPAAEGFVEPVLCVELEKTFHGMDGDDTRREILALGAQHEKTRAIKHLLFHDAFPVDTRHNAKIFREKLAVWAAAKLRGRA